MAGRRRRARLRRARARRAAARSRTSASRRERIVYMGTLGKAAGVARRVRRGAPGGHRDARADRAPLHLHDRRAAAARRGASREPRDRARRRRAPRAARRARSRASATRAARCRGALLPSRTPIQPLVVGANDAAIALSARSRTRGFFVPAIRPPTVPQGTARLRVSLSAAHAPDDVDALIDALARALRAAVLTDASAAPLHVESTGDGPPLVLLHGWAMHGGLFAPLVPRARAAHRVHAVDLPGHGHQRRARGRSRSTRVVDALARSVRAAARAADGARLVARRRSSRCAGRVARPRASRGSCWSRRRRASSPADDWPHAMDRETLARFGDELRVAVDARRCSASSRCRCRAATKARATLATLRRQLFSRGAPSAATLADGARASCATTDLRDDVAPHRAAGARRRRRARHAACRRPPARWLAGALPDARFALDRGRGARAVPVAPRACLRRGARRVPRCPLSPSSRADPARRRSARGAPRVRRARPRRYDAAAVLQREVGARMAVAARRRQARAGGHPRRRLRHRRGAGRARGALSGRAHRRARPRAADGSTRRGERAASAGRSRLPRLLARARAALARRAAVRLRRPQRAAVRRRHVRSRVEQPRAAVGERPAARVRRARAACSQVGGLVTFTTFGPDTLKELRARVRAAVDGHTPRQPLRRHARHRRHAGRRRLRRSGHGHGIRDADLRRRAGADARAQGDRRDQRDAAARAR